MDTRTLYLHTGGSKSGSSALQNFFVLNRQILLDGGVAYARPQKLASKYSITTGNGQMLINLTDPDKGDQPLLDGLTMHMMDKSRALVTNEAFEWLPAENWRRLIDMAASQGIRIHVIHFVRNTVPLLLSSYDQMIKRNGEARSLVEWAQDARLPVFEYLRRIYEFRRDLDITILSYDRHKAELPRVLLNEIGINLAAARQEINPIGQVNRSLAMAERDLLLDANRRFGNRYSKAISDMFILSRPELRAKPTWDEDLVRIAEDRFGDDVKWVNDVFFGSKNEVRLYDESDKANSRPRDDTPPAVTAESLMRNWMMDEMDKASEHSLVDYLISILRIERPDDAIIPADFDPITYVIINEDIRRARADPYRHFINSGFREGRPYKLKP